MHKFLVGLAAAALSAGVLMSTSANAMPLGPNAGLGDVADRLGAIEKSQFIYGGRNYCWYPDGWHGPGFYWCGYAFRRGFGWGGPMGWRGWNHGGPRVGGPRVGGPRMGGPGPRVGGPGPRVGGPRGGAPGFRKH